MACIWDNCASRIFTVYKTHRIRQGSGWQGWSDRSGGWKKIAERFAISLTLIGQQKLVKKIFRELFTLDQAITTKTSRRLCLPSLY